MKVFNLRLGDQLRLFLVILFYLVLVEGYSQTAPLSGRIIDSETNQGLPYANVFINKSTLGTATDASGNFNLLKVPYGIHELVVSYIGYSSYSTKVQVSSEGTRFIEVRLISDHVNLAEVQINGQRDKEWQNNLEKFKTIFLGSTSFAKSCKILNPWALEFNTDVNNTFYATAAQPLEIMNFALGYKVFYYLTSFIATHDSFNIQGQIRFEQLKTEDEKLALTWQQNRSTAYLGSYRHLFKSIIDGRTKQEGFLLYHHTGNTSLISQADQSKTFSSKLGNSIKEYSPEAILQKKLSNGDFEIQLYPKTEVHFTKSYSSKRVYKDVSFSVSWLEIKDGILRIDKNGVVVMPANLLVSGVMYDSRIADLLPENYVYGDKVGVDKMIDVYQVDKMKSIQEKVYVQTNTPYYYPGQEIWFKAYLNYRSPELMDSLSRVLYVELIDPNKNIISSKVLKIENGMAHGTFKLSEQLLAGTYFIRSYTQWMLNYKTDALFVKQVPVLNFSERPFSKPELYATDTSQIRIITNKETFRPREKIDVELAIKSDNPQEQLASFSVAITDTDQMVNVPDVTDIKNHFGFVNQQPEVELPFKYPIEFGISLTGKHVDKKDKPKKTSLFIVSKDYRNAKILDTRDDGTFWTTGFDFNDSTEVNFEYVNKSVREIGKINLTPRFIPPTDNLTGKLFFELEKSIAKRSIQMPDSTDRALLLNEVTVKASRIVRSKEALAVAKVYGKAEITLPGEALFKSSATSLVDALRGRVPGFNVLYDGNGGANIRLGPKSSFMGSDKTEPLLIIDGFQMAPGGPLTVFAQLQQISTTLVDRVEVIRFGNSAIYGSRGGNGVIIVYTKGGEFSFDQKNFNSNKKPRGFIESDTIIGYTPAVPILFPDYSSIAERSSSLYDLRSTIYWNPLIETNESGRAKFSFYAADLARRYKVLIEGVTIMGAPLRAVAYITVKK